MTETTKYTVESLQQERAKIRKQLEANKTAIVNHWASLVTPAPADTKVQMWVNQAEKRTLYMMALCSGISYSANSTILSAYSGKTEKKG